MEPFPKPPRSPCRTWWNYGGTLVEPSWNLASGLPRTTPEPIWAETPKLSAVGEKHGEGIGGKKCSQMFYERLGYSDENANPNVLARGSHGLFRPNSMSQNAPPPPPLFPEVSKEMHHMSPVSPEPLLFLDF